MQSKEDGIRARNRDFIRYEQVEKRQSYHLAESPDDEQFDDEFQIRTCDMRSPNFAMELGDALREIGFAILDGHGIDPALHDEAHDKVLEMFTRLSLDEKMRYRAQRHGSVNQGYFPIKETSNMHPDLVEGWVFCRRAFRMGVIPNREDGEESRSDGASSRLSDPDSSPSSRLGMTDRFWPLSEYESFFRKIVQAQERLILPIMQAMLASLGCDAHLYDRQLTGTNFGLRLNYYPPMTEVDEASGAARLLGHEDVDMFTFLPAPRTEGLQILNRRNMKWVRIDAPRGTIILNTGDYMQRISNDIFPSTTHRVSKPRDPAQRRQPRVSFPMAVYLREDEMLEVLPCIDKPKYAPIKAIQFHTSITSKFYGDDYAVKA